MFMQSDSYNSGTYVKVKSVGKVIKLILWTLATGGLLIGHHMLKLNVVEA